MKRSDYLRLAERGLCMPVGADLILHAEPDPAAVVCDGSALGRVVAKTARRFRTPLAVPTMDLQLEKALLLRGLGLPAAEVASHHFELPPTDAQMSAMRRELDAPLPPRLQAQVDAVAYIARREPELVPCGMTIGPFSLMTKLLKDPITPVYLAGMGVTADEDPSVACLERGLELAMLAVERSLRAQLAAGARLVFMAEPAANKVYVSPKQMEEGSDVFERLVMPNLRRYREILAAHGAELLFHCCGELTDRMIGRFCELDPAILSLGSSRPLWEVAPLVPPLTVLYGNLPSKQFYSDAVITVEQVRAQAATLVRRMREIGRPFILGTECDVLSVPGCETVIGAKVDALMEAGRNCAPHRGVAHDPCCGPPAVRVHLVQNATPT